MVLLRDHGGVLKYTAEFFFSLSIQLWGRDERKEEKRRQSGGVT